jgi:hypothetical protein
MSTPTARILPFRPVSPRVPVPPNAAASAAALPPVWLQVVFVTGAGEEGGAHWRRRVSVFLGRHGLVVRFEGGALGIASIGPAGAAPGSEVRRHVLTWLLSQPEVVLLREQTPWPIAGNDSRIDVAVVVSTDESVAESIEAEGAHG